MKGQRNKAAGEYFENMIGASCEWYKKRGVAFIKKTPEPMRPLHPPNQKGQFLACYTKAAQPDFKGTLKGGRSVVFEAKHTDSERIDYGRLTPEQIEDLNSHHELGALTFVLVSVGLQDFFRVPWEVWRDMQRLFGHKHMKLAELEPFRVQAIAGIIKIFDDLENGGKP